MCHKLLLHAVANFTEITAERPPISCRTSVSLPPLEGPSVNDEYVSVVIGAALLVFSEF